MQHLFSFQGRIGRLRYFGASLLAGTLSTIILLACAAPVLTALMSSGGANAAATLLATGTLSLLLFIATLMVAVWVQLALVWQRVRDFTGKTTLAWVYVALFPLTFIPILGLLALLGQLVLIFMFCLMPSKDGTSAQVNPDVFGEAPVKPSFGFETYPDAVEMSGHTGAAALLSEEVDLVARAAQLKEREAAMTPASPAASTHVKANGPKPFGMRKAAPAFGTR